MKTGREERTSKKGGRLQCQYTLHAVCYNCRSAQFHLPILPYSSAAWSMPRIRANGRRAFYKAPSSAKKNKTEWNKRRKKNDTGEFSCWRKHKTNVVNQARHSYVGHIYA